MTELILYLLLGYVVNCTCLAKKRSSGIDLDTSDMFFALAFSFMWPLIFIFYFLVYLTNKVLERLND